MVQSAASLVELLGALVRERGTAVLSDPRLCAGYLRDLAPEQMPRIHVLTAALEEGVPARLLSASAPDLQQPAVARHLESARMISTGSASWAVAAIAQALGIAAPALAPGPPPDAAPEPLPEPQPEPVPEPLSEPQPEPVPEPLSEPLSEPPPSPEPTPPAAAVRPAAGEPSPPRSSRWCSSRCSFSSGARPW